MLHADSLRQIHLVNPELSGLLRKVRCEREHVRKSWHVVTGILVNFVVLQVTAAYILTGGKRPEAASPSSGSHSPFECKHLEAAACVENLDRVGGTASASACVVTFFSADDAPCPFPLSPSCSFLTCGTMAGTLTTAQTSFASSTSFALGWTS